MDSISLLPAEIEELAKKAKPIFSFGVARSPSKFQKSTYDPPHNALIAIRLLKGKSLLGLSGNHLHMIESFRRAADELEKLFQS